MNDYLLELSKNPQAKKIVQSLGLPIPMPQNLKRAKGPSVERPLADMDVAVFSTAESELLEPLAGCIAKAGANPFTSEGAHDKFVAPGEAYGRLPTKIDLEADRRYNAVVLDATSMKTPEDLAELHTFFNALVRKIHKSGRAIVIGRPVAGADNATEAATRGALSGFVRSLAKEVGKKGTTAQLILVESGAESRIYGPLRFVLSPRSAYVSGQPLLVSAKAKHGSDASWTSPLEGKVALVTGAARGIGAATARLLASEGAKVVCLDRPADDGPTSKLAREIDGKVLLADVTNPEAPARINEFLKTECGGVDIVVHNAGVTRDKTIAKMPRELWDMTIDVNLGAIARITEALVAGALNDGGRVICLSSIAGIAGNMGQTNYSASKSGVIGFVDHLSTDLAGRGITVNAIAPGFIETRLTAAIPFAIREVARRMNNLGQGGRPDDVAQAINFLASPGAQGLTGQVLRVCGGSLVGA